MRVVALGIALAVGGCSTATSLVVKPPVVGKCEEAGLKGCDDLADGIILYIEGDKKEGEKKKSVTDFKLDFTKCSLCGSCVEVCPTDALEFSKQYNLASTTKTEYLQIDLVKRLEEGK